MNFQWRHFRLGTELLVYVFCGLTNLQLSLFTSHRKCTPVCHDWRVATTSPWEAHRVSIPSLSLSLWLTTTTVKNFSQCFWEHLPSYLELLTPFMNLVAARQLIRGRNLYSLLHSGWSPGFCKLCPTITMLISCCGTETYHSWICCHFQENIETVQNIYEK